MALDTATAQELIRIINADREQYLESLNRTTELLYKAIGASGAVDNASITRPQPLTAEGLKRNTLAGLEIESTDNAGSAYTGEDESSAGDGDSFFADTPLQDESYDIEGLINHIRTHTWKSAGKIILQNVLGNEKLLKRPSLFPDDLRTSDDRSHLSHGSIYDVGNDGLQYHPSFDSGKLSRSLEIWHRINSVNKDPDQPKACGKIICVREPSPLLFAALHYTMNKHFDMDELFDFLVDRDPILARPHNPFADDHRHRRTFVFNMEYFTLIGKDCEPMHWQKFDSNRKGSAEHIPLSRCSAVVALSLEGTHSRDVKTKDRRFQKKYGHVYDPFCPWRVLVIQCYPDWESTIEEPEEELRQRRHVVNGPEAFLTALQHELRDASKRLTKVYHRIDELVRVPDDFIFEESTREKLLFEDDSFTYSKRYFWATQTLSIMNQDIHGMIKAYQECLHDGIWDGTDKIVWPGDDMSSPRMMHWRTKRMASLRMNIEREIHGLQKIQKMNDDKIHSINGLRESLFSGTSVKESRVSIETATTAIQQNDNIRILTLVTIFFLPLTFVTSVFGMTNMPPNDSFDRFAWTTLAICLPTYLILIYISPQKGPVWWRETGAALVKYLNQCLAKFVTLFGKRFDQGERSFQASTQDPNTLFRPRSLNTTLGRKGSAEVAMAMRAVTGAALSPVMSRSVSQDGADVAPGTPIRRDMAALSPAMRRMSTAPTVTSPTTLKFVDFGSPMRDSEANALEIEVGPMTPVSATGTSSLNESDVKGGVTVQETQGTNEVIRRQAREERRSLSWDVFRVFRSKQKAAGTDMALHRMA